MTEQVPKRDTFRPNEHLRRPSDFRRVYDRKRSASDECLLVFGDRNGLEYSRVGLSVSRKQGGAVLRNRLRRLMREAYRLEKRGLPTGLDLVLIPRKTELELAELRKSLLALVKRVHAKLPKLEA